MIKFHDYSIIGKSNTKIVLVSDIHYYSKFKINVLNDLIIEINLCKPDYICIAGDLLDEAKNDDEVIYNWLIKLAKISKVILALGNHDFLYKKGFKKIYYSNIKWFNKLSKIKNLILLNNNSYETNNIIFHEYNEKFNVSNNKITYNFSNFNKNVNLKNYHIDLRKTNILICHSPQAIVKKNKLNDNALIKNMDLIMCGHMHNGLVFPIFDKILKHYGFISPTLRLIPNNAKGNYKINKTNIVICGGVTKFSNSSPKVLKILNKLYNVDVNIIAIKKS